MAALQPDSFSKPLASSAISWRVAIEEMPLIPGVALCMG
jgi:hypothetical protein